MRRHVPAHRKHASHGITAAVLAAVALAAGFLAGLAVPSPVTGAVPASVLAWQAPALPRAPAAPGKAASAAGYTVRPGDTLSGIAARLCGGRAGDWTGIYAASRAVIGADPGLIRAGQHLTVRCGNAPAPPEPAAAPAPRPAVISGGTYSYTALENLWISAGGPAWAAASAASVAECESGGRAGAYNPSGATGIWQILGQVVAGNLGSPYVNALNAVAKFRASRDTFAQWVCQASAVTGPADPAGITLDAAYSSPGAAGLDWAEAHAAGTAYAWGGTGPDAYDCSGLVSTAIWQAAGIWVGRDTYAMLASPHLARTYSPQRGDLAFYGSGHVEFVTSWYHTTFGAHDAGSRTGWITWGAYWAPTMFFRVR